MNQGRETPLGVIAAEPSSAAFQVARQTAALAAMLGGLDRFVFTGGIGEHAAAVRSMVVDRLALFGTKLDLPRTLPTKPGSPAITVQSW